MESSMELSKLYITNTTNSEPKDNSNGRQI